MRAGCGGAFFCRSFLPRPFDCARAMAGFFKRLCFAILLAALVAAGLVLWRSPDPAYTAASWFAGARYSRYDPVIADIAARFELDPLLVKAVVWRESAFRPEMIGTVGERGL